MTNGGTPASSASVFRKARKVSNSSGSWSMSPVFRLLFFALATVLTRGKAISNACSPFSKGHEDSLSVRTE